MPRDFPMIKRVLIDVPLHLYAFARRIGLRVNDHEP
jgi:hypothetical protein